VIINLISGPRNVSTALMYSFAQRSDTSVMDEPFYAVYLAKTGTPHPGAEKVLKALPHEEAAVRSQILTFREKPVLFIKNMAHHTEVLEEPFIDGARNIFLIRDPRQILASYAAVIAHPVMRDIGVAWQYTLFSRLVARGIDPVVVDSTLLLRDPPAVLSRVCRGCGLPYEQRMEHWPPGPKSYDGVWAPYWYGNVHRSRGFEIQTTTSHPLPPHLKNLYEEARLFYEKLLPFSLKA
jgi:hypothetical protein